MHRGPKLASPANKSVTKDVAGERAAMKAGQFIAVSLCAVAAATSAQARITRISITKVESPAFDGRAFGGIGQYEKLVGRATGEVDPSDPRNAIITDIALAPRNANGKVAYETDVMIFRPIDRSKGNRKTWYELTNRGAILAFTQINDGPNGNNPTKAADAGNGFLMAQGYTILLSGWDSSAPATQNRFHHQDAGRGQQGRLAGRRSRDGGNCRRRQQDGARQPELSVGDARQVAGDADGPRAL